jgi:hypothetical protein
MPAEDDPEATMFFPAGSREFDIDNYKIVCIIIQTILRRMIYDRGHKSYDTRDQAATRVN